jgi:hypothetical protein
MPTKTEKDVPLMLRRKRDGKLYLNSEKWPKRHDFGKGWLFERISEGMAAIYRDDKGTLFIELNLANGSATYKVTEDDGHDIYYSTLVEQEVK